MARPNSLPRARARHHGEPLRPRWKSAGRKPYRARPSLDVQNRSASSRRCPARAPFGPGPAALEISNPFPTSPTHGPGYRGRRLVAGDNNPTRFIQIAPSRSNEGAFQHELGRPAASSISTSMPQPRPPGFRYDRTPLSFGSLRLVGTSKRLFPRDVERAILRWARRSRDDPALATMRRRQPLSRRHPRTFCASMRGWLFDDRILCDLVAPSVKDIHTARTRHPPSPPRRARSS